MKNIFKKDAFFSKSLFLTICLLFSGWAASAQAANMIKVDFEDDPLFDIENFYPGMSVTKDVTVKNEDTVERDLYVTMDGMDNSDFADQINFYVIKKSSGKFFVGGSGDRMTLEDMDDEGSAFIERVAAGVSTDYEIKVKLKTSTGNEFQNEEIESFEVGLAFSDLPNPPAPPYRSGQLPGGNEEGAEEGAVEGVESEGDEQNQESGPEIPGTVYGEETECHGWPLWAWVVALVVYTIIFFNALFNNFKDQIKERNIHCGWPLIFVIAAFLFWYNFDKCQQYKWFIVSVLIGSAVVYLYYLKLYKKRLAKI